MRIELEQKDFIKYVLFLLGLRKTVPARFINKVKIKENNEKLVSINNDTDLFFAENNKKFYLRETVYKKIKQAEKRLPKNCHFKIYSAYRSVTEQTKLWEKNYTEMKHKAPDADEEELVRMTKAVCADPRKGFGGHQTGGAIDIGLCDEKGHEFNMGTAYLDTSDKIKTAAKNIDEDARINRKILSDALQGVGFVNYPNEWWHFCYGDRMWAAYKNKRYCFYGCVEKSSGQV